MELQLLERIKLLGYNGELTDSKKFMEALKLGMKSNEFINLVVWLENEIAAYKKTTPLLCATNNAPLNYNSIKLMLNCFFKSNGCTHAEILDLLDPVSQQKAYTVLDFMGTELKTCKLLEQQNLQNSLSMITRVEQSNTIKNLADMLIALNFEKPPDDITAVKLFTRLETKLKDVLKTAPKELVSQPLIATGFTEKEWNELQDVQRELHNEYRIRRDMLLKRFDVTVQSFLWSDRIKSDKKELNTKYENARKLLSEEPKVTFADLLASRHDIALVEKTSSATVRQNTKSSINSVIIGTVPDRGGRPYEQEPPPPEMPSWQKDRVPGPSTARGGYGGRGGGGGGGGGGYNRGGRGGGGSNTSFSSDNRGGSNYFSSDSGYGKQGGGYGEKQRGGYSGGQSGGQGGGGYGGGQGGGGYGGGQGGGRYSGGQGGQGGGYGGGQGGQGGGYGGGQGGQGGGYGGNQEKGYRGNQEGGQESYGGGYGGNQRGGYRGNQGGGQESYGGGYGGNNSYSGGNRDGGYGQRQSDFTNTGSSQSDKGGQQYQRGGSRGGRGNRVQGGWNQGNADNYQRRGNRNQQY